jgi:hypothetical protein
VIQLNNILFAASNNGIYKSTDHGLSWNLAINGMSTTTMLKVSSSSMTLLSCTSEGFAYKSTNFGDSWISVSDGLPSQGSTSSVMLFGFSGQNILCGTYSTGIFYRPLIQVVAVRNGNIGIFPTDFKLEQNYPNPFNPNTKIKFDISGEVKRKTLDVKLMIYDILGKEIQTLVNEQLNPGTYEVTFDGSNLPSGVYFYKLTSGEFTATKKLILLK